MNEFEYIARLTTRLEKRARGRVYPPEMLSNQLPDVLNELARRVYESNSRSRLEKVYTATLTSGAVNLGTSPFLDVWYDSLQTARVLYPVDGGSVKAEFYQNPSDLDLPGVTDAYRYSLIGDTLILRDWLPQVPADTAALSITASKIPLLSDLAALNLDNNALDIGVELATRMPQTVEVKAAEV